MIGPMNSALLLTRKRSLNGWLTKPLSVFCSRPMATRALRKILPLLATQPSARLTASALTGVRVWSNTWCATAAWRMADWRY
ncbi:hypothetical protein D3C75_1224420 [compost metagenome]